MKRALLISGLAAAVMAVVVPAGIRSSELDLPGLNQRIDNIDARTTNNEQDIQALQEATQTAPAEHVAVPIIHSAPAPIAAPTQETANPVSSPATPTPELTPCPTPVISNAPGMSITVIGGGCQKWNHS